jgi:hypothetical protein
MREEQELSRRILAVVGSHDISSAVIFFFPSNFFLMLVVLGVPLKRWEEKDSCTRG